MSLEAPKNGIYIVLGEVNHLILANKRNINRYKNHHYVSLYSISLSLLILIIITFKDTSQDPLIKNFCDLKILLNTNSGIKHSNTRFYLNNF